MSDAADALREFADSSLWLTWRYETRQGSSTPTKVPYAHTGLKASSTDSSTWSTRTIAEHTAKRDNRDGIGIVLAPLSEGRHLGGVDLDVCIGADGTVAPWAREIVELLSSYTEVSPSELGLKVFFTHDERETRADGVRWRSEVREPAPDGGKEPGIEFYLRARYFTVTDATFEQYDTIRAVDLDTLREVQRRMDAFDNKPKASTRHSTHHQHRHDDDQQRLFDALSSIPGEDTYGEWVKVGMALHAEVRGSDAGYRAFVAWSAKSSKFDARHCEQKWQEWASNPARDLTGGTIIYLARQNGWQDPRQRTNGTAAKTADPKGNDDKDAAGDAGKERGPKQANILIDIAGKAKLFHTADGTGFADLEVNGHRETWPIQRKDFRRWLMRRFYEETGGAPNSEALQSALGVIQSKAQFDADAPEREVYIRIGEHGGKLYLDLCDDKWRAVEIDDAGWRVIENPPLRFRRAAGMQPLPEPQPGGSIEKLRDILNVAPGNDFVLVVSWALACLRNRGPYPVLALAGEQGAGKSLFAALLRSLLDPNTAALRSLPREDRDLFIAASNGHVLAFDNVSGLPAWISDTLCRLSTGGGFAVRQLYTDQDEVLFDAARPLILNGIEDIVGRSDLADRTIFLTLPLIAEDRRRTEAEIWSEFEKERPGILGALLDAVAEGLKRLPETRLAKLPRMADFAMWVTACEPALWKPGTFMKAYTENIGGAVDAVIDADPVGDAIRTMMTALAERESDKQPEWKGAAKDLLEALATQEGERIAKSKSWPEGPRALSGRLRRAMTGLRKIGIEVGFTREGHARARTITITGAPNSPEPERVGNFASAPSAPSAAKAKFNDLKDLAAPDLRTQNPDADANAPDADANAASPDLTVRPTVRTKPFKNGHEDDADAKDANSPTQSGPRVERRL